MVKSFPTKTASLIIKEDMDPLEIEVTTAVPIGLIINEAVTNSLKHAFKNIEVNPTITLKMKVIYDRIQICLSDNGPGFINDSVRKDNALGLSLIESLADQIDGEVTFKNEGGTNVSLMIPI